MPDHLTIEMGAIAPNISAEGTKERDTQKPNTTEDSGFKLGATPTPIYRHAAPSGPWPWMDFDVDILSVIPPTSSPTGRDEGWGGYPQSKFPNWTKEQVDRCGILKNCASRESESTVFKVDVLPSGKFGAAGHVSPVIKDKATEDEFWKWLKSPRELDLRVRALFVKNMTKDVLQMFGTRYTIEPFFFSSSANWIPSRYQENLNEDEKSDHITIVLPFIRVVDQDDVVAERKPANQLPPQPKEADSSQDEDQIIDTQSPLYLNSCNKYVLQDLLSIHMVRGIKTSTIISCHPDIRMTTPKQLHSLIKRTGDSVYWQKIFEKSKDPTCLYLCFLWYAMYEWDELFEVLYEHINYLEQLVLDSDKIRETRDLHILQAHLLYYRTLLEDFKQSVIFVQETKNPAMHDRSVTTEERELSEEILKKETDYLISEIDRLESQRSMQVDRLKNVIDLAFSTVNIEDSDHMKRLTFATVRDSAAMKQISYLTMVFLPANFLSNVFSMNIIEINPSGGETLVHYIAGAFGLTFFASWVVVALQVESVFFPPGSPAWRRVGWPVFFVWDVCLKMYRRKFGAKDKTT